MTLHTYNPQLMSLPSINFLHITISRQNFIGQHHYGKVTVQISVRNSLQSSGGPIGPLGSEVQWPLLKLDGPNVKDYIFLKYLHVDICFCTVYLLNEIKN